MKRCPQCQFIYPDSDERCDFDKTPLVDADDAEIDAATGPFVEPATANLSGTKSNPRSRKALPIAAGVGLTLGLILFGVYYGLSHKIIKAPAAQSSKTLPSEPAVAPPQPPLPSPSPVASPSPEASPLTASNPSASRKSTSPSSANGPVSTSGGSGAKLGGKPVILLSSGGRVAADDVWRTREGVWYRRDGVVTLLKHGQVKAIVNK